MNKQITLSVLSDELAQAGTSKKAFLSQIERIIPWDEWIGIIKPHYYKGERERSSARAKVEHVFAVVKGLFRYRKTRYRGLRKQSAKLHMLFALANLLVADRHCLTA